MKPTDFAIRLTSFLGEHLANERKLSRNTIRSYRDTFALFLRYCRDARNLPPERLTLDDVDSSVVLAFLGFLERDRGCKPRTRNQRLCAIHSFYRYLQAVEPQRILHCQRILAIPFQQCERPIIGYLSQHDLATLLAQPNLETPRGRRDAVLLSLLYDTGARVQEIIDLSVEDVRLDSPAQVRLMGKGRKSRIVPLMMATVELLKEYVREHHQIDEHVEKRPFFSNHGGGRLSRSGVTYILRKYFDRSAQDRTGNLARISPHKLRHSKGMHLAEAGIPVEIIRDILGHVDLKTTSIYARTSVEMKRQALERTSPPTAPKLPFWRENADLMSWLRTL